MQQEDNTQSNEADENYIYQLPFGVTVPVFEVRDYKYYHWVIAGLFPFMYKAGMSRQEFIGKIQSSYDSAVQTNNKGLVNVWPKPDELEYLIDWFVVFRRFVEQRPKDYKIFRD